MTKPIHNVTLEHGIVLGGEQPVLIAGSCVIESYDLIYQVASYLRDLTQRLGIPFVFKSSYDKANRTSHRSYRSMGFESALNTLARVRHELNIPVLTDVHETIQIEAVAAVTDVLQIPAFLCRQTDLLLSAGHTGQAVNIKRGQFMAPEDMEYAVEKVRSTGNNRVFLTERGFSFGYHNLVVDMRALPIMRQFAPVIFDVTHSVQKPGGQVGASDGQREFAPYLARAAAAVGVDGFFIETHPNPPSALSDGSTMISLDEMPSLLESLLTIWYTSRPFVRLLS
jgi:2-dehydro-3-deoxyphosphooctonate aldolase (KDO 8-P synthase)